MYNKINLLSLRFNLLLKLTTPDENVENNLLIRFYFSFENKENKLSIAIYFRFWFLKPCFF